MGFTNAQQILYRILFFLNDYMLAINVYPRTG